MSLLLCQVLLCLCQLSLNFDLMTSHSLGRMKKFGTVLHLHLVAAMTFLGMYGAPKLLCQLYLAYHCQATGYPSLHTRLA